MSDAGRLIEAMAKHLPPSAASPRVLDVNGEAGAGLAVRRPDLTFTAAAGDATTWAFDPASFDAVVALDYTLNEPFLVAALAVLRPGGRLIVVNGRGGVDEAFGRRLEASGYVRILVEGLAGGGVLLRGEQRHDTADTLARIERVAGTEADRLDLTTFKGRYVHLLIRETPNKPVWARRLDEPIRWEAAVIQRGDDMALLAFSSLPKAVSFMQPAVLGGHIRDVNKVGKFRRDYAAAWTLPVLVNPDQSVFETTQVTFVEVDPNAAEAPDE